jgi:glycosyltransferase involved in cell wall biosynthesis
MHTKKIKVLFQLNELSFSGTTKAVITFCRYLDRTKFEPFLFYKGSPKDFRYYRMKLESFLSKKKKRRFEEFYLTSQTRLPEFEQIVGKNHIACGTWFELKSFVDQVRPEILHLSRGIEHDWFSEGVPLLDKSVSVVETSIFGKAGTPAYTTRLDLVFMVSQWLSKQNPWAGNKGRVFYLPILKPAHSRNLRSRLNIPENEMIVGRISRPGLDEGNEVLKIFNKIKTPCRLLFLGGGEKLIEAAKTDSRIIYLPPTIDDHELSEFYNSIDVLLHYRREGETYGMSIADAMMHGKPVVSHFSFLDNAQAELLNSECGFVVKENDFDDHAKKIDLLLGDRDLRERMGKACQDRARMNFAADVVTKNLEQEYLRLRA